MSIEALKEKARQHEQKEQWEKALDHYLQAIRQLDVGEEQDISLFNRVGDLEVRLGQVERAVEHYERAVDLYVESELPNNAIAVCKKVVRNLPERHSIYLKMGQIRAHQGFLTDARQNFLTYAEQKQAEGDLEEAFRALIEFVELAPEDIEIRLALASQLAQHDRVEEAVEQYREARRRLILDDRDGEADEVAETIRELAPDVELLDPEAVRAAGAEAEALETPAVAEEDDWGMDFSVEDEDTEEEAPEAEVEAGLGEISSGGAEAEEPAEAAQEEEVEAGGLEGFDIASDDDEEEEAAPVAEEEVASVEEEEAEGAADLPMMDFGGEDEEEEEEEEAEPLPTMGIEDGGDAEDVEDAEEVESLPTMGFEGEDAEEGEPLPGPGSEEEEVEEDEAAAARAEEAREEAIEEAAFDARREEADDVAAVEEEADTAEESVDTAEESWLDEVETSSESEAPPRSEPAPPAEEEAVEREPDDLRAEGERLLAEGDEEGLELLDRAHEALAEADRVRDAVVVLRRMTEERPEDVALRQRLVEYAYRTGDQELLAQAYLDLAGALHRSGARQKARAAYQQVLDTDPQNPEAKEALEELSEEAEPASSGPRSEVASSEEYVDLGSMILDEEEEEKSTRFVVPAEAPSGDEQADFSRMLDQFKDKVAENVSTDDVSAHYDLGTAYKEMGLVDEAIGEFQAALRASRAHLPTYEMLGQCFLEKGQAQAAVRTLEKALDAPHEVEDELLGIYYYLGRAHEEIGQEQAAVDFYDKVFALDINFMDVTERLRDLR